MSYRNDRLNDAMVPLGAAGDPDRSAAFSDRGAGAAHIRRAPDGDAHDRREGAARRRARLTGQAMLLLLLTGRGRLCTTLGLVAENGRDRAASLAELPRPTYFWQLKELLKIFLD